MPKPQDGPVVYRYGDGNRTTIGSTNHSVALDRAEKAQRLARRLIQEAIGRSLRAEFESERQDVPAHIRQLLNQCEQKPDNKQK
jgi:hypothetical protein